MIRYGRNVPLLNDYRTEVEYSKNAGFELHQVWYDKRGLSINGLEAPVEVNLREFNFPCVLHALLDITEFEEHLLKVGEITQIIGSDDIIIHIVCQNEPISLSTPAKLSQKIKLASSFFKEQGITTFIENNSKKDPINYKPEELRELFKENPDVEFLIDIAHIDSYKHLTSS